MTANELTKHLSDECTKILVECSLCEVIFIKECFDGHDCGGELRKKVDAARNDVKEAEERVKNVND